MPTQNVEINDKIEILLDAGVGNVAIIPISSTNCSIAPFATQTSPYTFTIKDFSNSSYTADFTNESGDVIQISGSVSNSGNWFTDDEQYQMKAEYGNKSVVKSYNINKIKEGATGEAVSARSVNITSPTQAIIYDSTGSTPTPSAAFNLTATVVNTSGTVYYEWLIDGTPVQNTTSSTYSYTPQSGSPGYFGMPDVVTVRIREGGSSSAVLASDVFSIYGVLEGGTGVDSISILLSNEAHVFPTDFAGAATGTITGSSTFITVLEGATELDYDATGTAAGKWTVSAVADNSGISISTPSDVGLKASYPDHTNLTIDVETITYTITGKTLAGDSFSLQKQQSIAKGKGGNDGKKVQTGLIYYATSTGNPGDPSTSGAATYTFSTDAFAGVNANWSSDKPTITASQVNNYWQRRYVAVENTPGSDIANQTQANLTFPGSTVKFQDGFGDSVTQSVDEINAESFKWNGANSIAFNYDGTYYQPRASNNWLYTYSSTSGDKEYTQGGGVGGNTFPWLQSLHTFYKGNTAVAEIRLRHLGRPGSEITTGTYDNNVARSIYYDFQAVGSPGSVYSTESNYTVTINTTAHTSAFNGGTTGPTSNGFDQIQDYDGPTSGLYSVVIEHTPSKSITTVVVTIQSINDAPAVNPGNIK